MLPCLSTEKKKGNIGFSVGLFDNTIVIFYYNHPEMGLVSLHHLSLGAIHEGQLHKNEPCNGQLDVF